MSQRFAFPSCRSSRTRASKHKLVRAFRPGLEQLEARCVPASFLVNSLLDQVDLNPGDGVADAGGGVTTLRAAIMEANALAGADEIILPAGTYNLTLAGTELSNASNAAVGDLDIVGDLKITGAGAAATIVDASGIAGGDRVMEISQAASIIGYVVEIEGLTMRGGLPTDSHGGGGLLSWDAQLTLRDITLSSNASGSSIASQPGGGLVIIDGTTSLIGCTIVDNRANGDGGGIYAFEAVVNLVDCDVFDNQAGRWGGGVSNFRSALTIQRSTIAGNTAAYGGGIHAAQANNPPVVLATTLVATSVHNNTATVTGGGIYAALGVLTIDQSTISDNKTVGANAGHAGGVYGAAVTMNFRNSTISGNSAVAGGGGVFLEGSSPASFEHVTITGNSAGSNAGGGGIARFPISAAQTVSVRNTIVAGNTAVPGVGPDINNVVSAGSLISLGHNLIGSGLGHPFVNGVNGDIVGVAALLGPLADNGGPTRTHAPQLNSPALDAADPADTTATDQRGASRPADGNGDGLAVSDIGAFEAAGFFQLTVALAGSGGGTVTSVPAGIDAPADASEFYPAGTVVTLTASPDSQSVFTGWTGAGTGTGDRTIVMDANNSVTANFDRARQSILGRVYHDQNQNLVQDLTEPGLASFLVYLDINLNGQHDPLEQFDLTDVNGDYELDNRFPGSYVVGQDLFGGWIPTAPPTGFHTVVLVAGQDSTGNDFGNFQQPNTAPTADDDGPYAVAEGGTLNVTAFDGVLSGDTDPDTDPLMAVLVSGPVHAAASGFTLNPNGSFTYVHDGSETTADSFTYLANDGTADSNVATVTIAITAVNDPPVINLPGPPLSTWANDPQALLEPQATVTDVDSPSFALGSLQVRQTSAGGDQVAVRNQGSAPGQIGVSGSTVTFGGAPMGSILSVAGTLLHIDLHASASPVSVQALVRNLTYALVAANPVSGPRTLQVVLEDGSGGSGTATTTVVVTARPGTVYVDDNWAGLSPGVDPDGAGPANLMGVDAFAVIQHGINTVQTGGTVYVAPGSYAESIVVAKDLVLAGTSGRAGDVVIDPAVGDGITLTGTAVTLAHLRVTGAALGIRATGVASLTLNNVESIRNRSNGMLARQISGVIDIDNSSFSANDAVGCILMGPFTSLTIDNSSFNDNWGGGLRIQGSAATATVALTTVDASTNRGNALTIANGVSAGDAGSRLRSLTVNGGTFNDNAGSGFVANGVVSATVSGITATLNDARGLRILNSQASLLNSTLTGNAVGVELAGSTTRARVQGNDLSGNTTTGLFIQQGAQVDAGGGTHLPAALGNSSGANTFLGYASPGSQAIRNYNAGPAGFGFTRFPPDASARFNAFGTSSLKSIEGLIEHDVDNGRRGRVDFSAPVEQDGISDAVENAAPHGGDGNQDGILDSQQPNVASLPNAVNGSYLTIVAPPGTSLRDVQTIPNPSPAAAPRNATFPFGFLTYTIEDVPIGGSANVTILLQTPVKLNVYYKFGPTSNNTTPHWYEFTFDGITGAKLLGPSPNQIDTIELRFVDGRRGDDDLRPNGVIVDPGGPALVTNAAPSITSLSSSAALVGSVTEGQPVRITAAFTDADVGDSHTAVINWGDGTRTPGTVKGLSVSGSHAYAVGGVYTISVTVTDASVATDAETTRAFVTGAGVQGGVLHIVGTRRDDHVFVTPHGQGSLRVHADFLRPPSRFRDFRAAGIRRVQVYLADGHDQAVIAGTIALPTVLDGGNGNDVLLGGGGPNVLLGGDGHDLLRAGRGRNLLIGGRGSDVLFGLGGQDLLIGGTTAFDANVPALLAVLAEWNSTRSYATRVANLRAGSGSTARANGSYFLKSGRPRATILEDQARDILMGGGGQDWFFADLDVGGLDRITDSQPGELVDDLD